MTTLRELSEDLRGINEIALDPDVSTEALADTIEGLEGMFNDKAVKIVHVIANNDSDIAAVDTEIKRLQERKKVMANAKDRLKEYLRFNMEVTGTTKITSDLFTITLAKPMDIVVVDDAELIPKDYQRVTIAPDKTLIKKALKDGYDVAGTHLGKGLSSVRIK
jgi:hypothetical protein